MSIIFHTGKLLMIFFVKNDTSSIFLKVSMSTANMNIGGNWLETLLKSVHLFLLRYIRVRRRASVRFQTLPEPNVSHTRFENFIGENFFCCKNFQQCIYWHTTERFRISIFAYNFSFPHDFLLQQLEQNWTYGLFTICQRTILVGAAGP